MWSFVWDECELCEIAGVNWVFLMSPAGGETELATASSAAELTGVLRGSAKRSEEKRRNIVLGVGGVVEGEERPGISTATLSINHDLDSLKIIHRSFCELSHMGPITPYQRRKQHAPPHGSPVFIH